MKNYLHPTKLPLLTLGMGGLCMALRFWLLASADEAGLVKAGHPAIFLTLLLGAVTLAGLFLLTKPLGGQGKYSVNFPRSLPAAAGCWAAAAAFFLRSMGVLLDRPDALAMICGVLGVFAVPCLILAGLARFQGQRTHFLLHTVVALAFMGQILGHYRAWSACPAIHSYCCQLLATVFLLFTAYHRAEFDARFGSRRIFVFMSLAAVFFCLLAIPEGSGLFYLACGAWALTGLCSLRPGKRRARPAIPTEQPAAGSGQEDAPSDREQ